MARKAGAFWALVSQMEAGHCYCSFHAIRPLAYNLTLRHTLCLSESKPIDEPKDCSMELTPREKDKLLIFTAGAGGKGFFLCRWGRERGGVGGGPGVLGGGRRARGTICT